MFAFIVLLQLACFCCNIITFSTRITNTFKLEKTICTIRNFKWSSALMRAEILQANVSSVRPSTYVYKGFFSNLDKNLHDLQLKCLIF